MKDVAGNALAEDEAWTFTTAAPPPPPPDEGPGGPIAVIGSAENPFGRYYAEILRNEGFNAFTATDISNVNAGTLDEYETVILGEMPLTDVQVSMFTDWVGAGGNLIAMRPDPKLADLLGLTNASGTLANEYLRVDTATSPGKGIVGQTIQFHGDADLYSLGGGTREVATLYSNANTATQNPAVTLRDVGANGGQAAAFTYDLARSVVYTRQGNPAWEGQNRDVTDSGDPGIRANDMFYGAKAGDVQPDWINLDKVQIPQADEQQRLLANMIGQMNLDKKPLPRFWYFPRAEEAVIIMTGDDHAGGQTNQYFDYFKQESPQGCSVADWECIRGTSYMYPNTPLSDAQAKAYQDDGFEVALHMQTGCTSPWTAENLEDFYRDDLSRFRAEFPSVEPPTTNRTHCIAWSDWVTQPKVELDNGIRLDTNYYYYPGPWIKNRAGMFTGSGMPMRFADKDGSMIDVYQSDHTDDRRVGLSGGSRREGPHRQRDRRSGRAVRRRRYSPAGLLRGVQRQHAHRSAPKPEQQRLRQGDRAIRQAARRAGRHLTADAPLARRPQRLLLRGPELGRRHRRAELHGCRRPGSARPAGDGAGQVRHRGAHRPHARRRPGQHLKEDDQGRGVRLLPRERGRLRGHLRGSPA